jgi:heat shock protein HtpX
MNSAYSVQNKNNRNTWILILLFIGLVSALFYFFAWYYNSPFIAVIGLIVSLGQSFVAYYYGDSIALAVAGAKQVSQEEAAQLHNLVENLSKVAGIPKPKVFVSPDESANAFACGRDPEHASVCVNLGLLKLLNKSELEGVLAHEISHIKNRDILVMTVTMVLASLISFLVDIGFRLTFFGGRDRDKNSNPVVLIIYLALIILAPFISILIQMAVSRSREYLADASAVVLTRYPEGLVSALNKLYTSPVPTSHYSTSMNHFYIAPPKKSFGEKFSKLFSTHPSLDERISALKKMA